MVRTSKNQPSPLDAGALDDLDLDDMFADDGDMLFEGLDIQLEGMGDIITTEASSSSNKKQGGRGAKGSSKKNSAAADNDETGGGGGGGGSTLKRRKTKRKTKTPVAFGDEDDDYVEEAQPKKRRKSSATNNNSKAGKAAAAAAAAAATIPPPAATTTSISTKRKTKKGGDASSSGTTITTTTKTKKSSLVASSSASVSSSMIPPPSGIARGTSATVAAAGRFGKRGGASGGSGKVTGTKRKSKSSSAVEGGGSGAHPSTPAPPPLFVPKQESVYGGLHPSKTQFYPFLESVPPEPSLKSRKQFPHFDRLFQALNTVVHQATGGQNGKGAPIVPDIAAAVTAGLDMESPIVQLLLESYEGISEKDKQSFGEQRKQALLGSIPELRKSIEGMDQMKLLSDLYGMCGLLTRQYNFVKTSLTNMETWCQATFTDTDYRQAYSLPEPFRPEKVGMVITAANRKWKKTVIPLKIVFAGYKETKGTPVLQAKLPPAVVALPLKKETPTPTTSSTTATTTTTTTTTTTKTKKKKNATKPSAASNASTTKSSAGATASAPKAPAGPKSYADCPPPERRQRILDRVAQLALGLESQLNNRRTKRSPSASSAASASSTAGSADGKAGTVTGINIPPEDPPLHTARMWEWLEAAGFFHSKNATKELRLQSPEIYPRGLLLPTPTRIQGRQEKYEFEEQPEFTVSTDQEDKIKAKQEATPEISSNGLYDRLQSLLVVEDEDENDDAQARERREKCAQYDDDSDMDSASDEEESLSFLDDDDDDDDEYDIAKHPSRQLADLSKLSMEERTFVHLCSVGLIKKSLFPLVELVLEDGGKDDTMEDDLVNVIGEMSEDLSTLTARNNSRIAYLESAMDPLDVSYRKQLEEEQASITARCQSLLKRSKEKAKKSNKQKSGGGTSSNKDGLNLPW